MGYYTDKYEKKLALLYFLADIDEAILHPSLDVDSMLDEVVYLKAEFDKLRKTEPTTISTERLQEIESNVRGMVDDMMMPFWYKMISNCVLPDAKRVERVFEYYYEKEDFEKCEVIKRAKAGDFEYLLNLKKNENGSTK